MKKIEIIPIARKKSERRGISEEWNSPMQIVEGYGGRKVAHRRYIIPNTGHLI